MGKVVVRGRHSNLNHYPGNVSRTETQQEIYFQPDTFLENKNWTKEHTV